MNWLVPPTHLTLDIETAAGDPTEAEAALRWSFCPNPNWKAATIGERYLEALERKKERLALLDTAPIISVALRTPIDCRLLHWLPLDVQQISGVPLERLADERAMLQRLREYLETCGPETILVGHNLRHFDLPKIRLAMIRWGLRLPACLANPDQPTYDTMSMWRHFSTDDKSMISLDECLTLVGLHSPKKIVTGADVPRLYQKGDYLAIAAYAIADVLAQDELYLWMTGQTSDRAVEEVAVPTVPSEASETVPLITASQNPVVSASAEATPSTEPAVGADAQAVSASTSATPTPADDITTILAELGIP
jgi:DNA polymerase III epsilon subunit-like protein